MRTTAFGSILLAALVTVPAAGCFRGERLPDLRVYWASVVVDGRTSLFGDATVYLQPATGHRRRIGTIETYEREEFTVEDVQPGSYRLLLRQGTNEYLSPRFHLANGDAVEWRLDTNHVMYRGQVIIDDPGYPIW